jgi:Uma2 family endonuclease
MATKTLLTVEDFLRRSETPDRRYELVEGELITLSPTMPEHNEVRDTLLVALRNFLAGRGLGRVWSEQAFHLFGDTVRIPDLSFVRAGRSIEPRQLPEGAPDLAVEVISPSNTPRELDRRISDYFAAGCKRVWLVYPEHREVYVHGLAGVVCRRGDDLLEDPELLPGFFVKVSSLFGQTEG